jgi:hypothetical protein
MFVYINMGFEKAMNLVPIKVQQWWNYEFESYQHMYLMLMSCIY